MAKQFPLSVAIGAVDNITAPMRGILGVAGAQITRFEQRFGNPLARGWARLGGPQVANSFAHAAGAARNFGAEGMRVMRGVSTAAAGAAVGLYAIAHQTAKAGDEAAKAASKIGVGVESLQEYRYAANLAGVEQQKLDQALLIFGRNAGDAAAGTGEGVVAFDALGIALRDAQGNVRGIDSLLPEVADKLSRVEDATTRNALAAKLFGARGIGMVNVLGEGSAGLAQMADEARRMGAVISADATRAAEEFGDSQSRVSIAMLGVRNRIGSELLPVLTGFQNNIAGWLAGNGPRITVWARQFAAQLPERLRQLRDGGLALWNGLRPGIALGAALIQRFGGVRVIGTALALLLGGKLLVSTLLLGKAVLGLGIALLTTPIGWILGGIAAITAAIVYWGDIVDWATGLWDRLWGSTKGAELPTPAAPEAGQQADVDAALARVARDPGRARQRDELRVSFENAPRGVRVERTRAERDGLDFNVGYAMLGTG